LAETKFEKLLLEAVDEAFDSLGNSAKQAIYFHLERKFKISKKEIPNRINDFTKGLEKIFGVGAKFLEILIIRKIYEKTGKSFKWKENKEFLFQEYVAAARHSFLRERKGS